MLDSTVVDVVQGAAAAIGAGAVGSFGWLTSKLFGAWRHEVNDMKQNIASNTAALSESLKLSREHAQRDSEIQGELLANLRELRGYMKGQEAARVAAL